VARRPRQQLGQFLKRQSTVSTSGDPWPALTVEETGYLPSQPRSPLALLCGCWSSHMLDAETNSAARKRPFLSQKKKKKKKKKQKQKQKQKQKHGRKKKGNTQLGHAFTQVSCLACQWKREHGIRQKEGSSYAGPPNHAPVCLVPPALVCQGK
jgi:hypothetical protein